LKTIRILKSTGDIAGFNEQKLQHSLSKSGATEDVVQIIIKEIRSKLYDGMPTRKIYKIAFQLLKQLQPVTAARYKVKNAIMELGPAGFVFEKYISAIFEAWGFQVKLNQLIQGQCVKHEVDLLAENKDILCIVECKYHNLPGNVCDVKIPLYFHSRFNDVAAVLHGEKRKITGWLVTNTKFTNDAITYGSCAGLKLLSWNHPSGETLRDIIDKLRLYPVTCLTSITKKEKMQLLEHNILLCRQLQADKSLLSTLNLSPYREEKIIEELSAVS
jgi:hypothetical protein